MIHSLPHSTMASKTEFANRRKRLLEQLPPDSIAIVASAPELYRNGDTHFAYRQNSNFYYLTGFTEPDAVAVFVPGRQDGEFILFNRPKDPSKEVWTGYYAGQGGAVKDYAANQSFPISELTPHMLNLLAGKKRIYYTTARDPKLDQMIMQWVHELQMKVRAGISTPTEFFNLDTILHEMRLIKSPTEIAIMQKAADISVATHKRIMGLCRPDMYEYQIQAEIEYEFKYHGAMGPAYGSIVAGGKNACILHYVDNNAQLKDGDLLLVDAGCEYEFYASDITRTFPINGKFNPAQRALYEVVLRTQLATIDLVRPGIAYNTLQDHVRLLLTEGLVELGILDGDPEKLCAAKAYAPFYMHNFGHWLGLDTHDAGTYTVNGEWRKLQPGTVVTIEPGLYIAHDDHNVHPKWRGIGIRIEDDVLVTETGHHVLTGALPKSIADVEALCQR